MKELGRNEEYVFYLNEDGTYWCRYENALGSIQSENWHVLMVCDLNGAFSETLIMDSETNQIIDSLHTRNLESIACRIDILKLANKHNK